MATATDPTIAVRSQAPPAPPDRFRLLTAVVACAAPAALILIVFVLFQQAWPAVIHYGLGFLVGTNWNPVSQEFGALPGIFGTVSTSLIAAFNFGASGKFVSSAWQR